MPSCTQQKERPPVGLAPVDYVNSMIKSDGVPKSEWSNNSVYVLVDDNNKVRYVGITNDPNRREKEHKAWYSTKKDYHMVVVMSGLDRKTARAEEQILISAFTLEAVESAFKALDNGRRGIAVRRMGEFKDELNRALEIMRGSGIGSASATLEDIEDLFGI